MLKIWSIIFLIAIATAIVYFSVNRFLQQKIAFAEQAYIYSYPLVLMKTTQQMMTDHDKYNNTFISIPEFPTSAFKTIVRPNVDTLYSFAWLDLAQGPLVLSVPDTHERYYLIEFLDAWTNVFASVGKRTTGTKAQKFIITGPVEKDSNIPENYSHIKAPTNMVLLLARTQTYGKKDYDFVHRIQSEYRLTPPDKQEHNDLPIAISALSIDTQQAPVEQVAAMDATAFYTSFVDTIVSNPPTSLDAPFMMKLKKIGIEPGKFEPSPEELSLLDQSIKPAVEKIKMHTQHVETSHGWSVMLNIGTYETNYLLRAFVAYLGIGANLPEDAIYPTTFVDADGKPLTGKNNYRIHFDKGHLPPVHAFWSITVYNEQSFLVKNPANRYSLNDRDPLSFNEDGSLNIYLQHEFPGAEKESNWLPTPEAEFNITMRLYWPKESALHGQWQPPAVEKVE